MLDYINWYCVEIKLRLAGKIDEDRAEMIVREIEGHLNESSKRLMETRCLSPEMAAKAAVIAFGKPDKIVMGYLRESNPTVMGLRPSWLALGGAFVATACWTFHWASLSGYFDNFGATWQNGLAGIIGLFALVVFVLGVRSGYRSYRGPILALGASTALGIVLLTSFLVVGSSFDHQGLSRLHLSRDTENAQKTIATLNGFKDYLAQGQAIYSKATSPKDVPASFRNAPILKDLSGLSPGETMEQRYSYEGPAQKADSFFVPRYCMAEVDGRVWGVDVVSGFTKAKKEWANVSEAEKSIVIERQKFEGLLASASEARSGRLFFFNSDVYGDPVAWTIIFMPLLLILDGVASALGRRRPAWPGRLLA